MNYDNNKFLKVGRVYWIKPKPIPDMSSKMRPAIMLQKFDNGKTIFAHIGSTEFNEPSSKAASYIFNKTIKGTEKIKDSFIHIDASKPEWNTSVVKPHFENNKYLDLDKVSVDKIRNIYHIRVKQLEDIRMRKAKISLIKGDIDNARKQLEMLKDQNPIKHSALNIEEFIKKYENI